MGLHVYVYKHPLGDCTNRGISSNVRQLCLVNVEGPFEPKADTPAAMLVTNPFGSVVIKPAIVDPNGSGEWIVDPKKWFMMGGNYGAASDSRLSEALMAMGYANTYIGIPIHDRVE